MTDRIRVCERREIDELIVLDIAATPNNRSPRFDEARALCENLFMPVTVGGGVRNVNDIRRLLESGADKVAINSVAADNPKIIDDASRRFGAQSIVISVDVAQGFLRTRCGTVKTEREPVAWAQECEARGAGEILLTDIERDGTMEGYNLDLIRSVSEAVSIPVIACGGCGSYEHMEQAFNAGAHAVAVGAMFQFTEATPRGAARYLNEHGIPAR